MKFIESVAVAAIIAVVAMLFGAFIGCIVYLITHSAVALGAGFVTTVAVGYAVTVTINKGA